MHTGHTMPSRSHKVSSCQTRTSAAAVLLMQADHYLKVKLTEPVLAEFIRLPDRFCQRLVDVQHNLCRGEMDDENQDSPRSTA